MSRLAIIVLVVALLGPPSASMAADEQVVFTQSANGIRSTRPFTVGDHWEIRWDSQKGITVGVMRADADPKDPLSKLPVASGTQLTPGAGATYIETGGRYYLQITSMGDWTVKAVQLP